MHGRAPGRHHPASRFTLAGLGVAVVGAAVQASNWRAHKPWNHNDAYHLIQVGALACLKRAGHAALTGAY